VDCCDVAQREVLEDATHSGGGEARDATPGSAARARSAGSGWRSSSTLGAIAVALLPKCPACWSAYAGLSSLLGLSFVVEECYLLPLTCALLTVSLAALGLQARRQRRYGPWLLACSAAIATLVGKFALMHDGLMYAGIGSLLLASLWSSCRWGWQPRRAPLSQPG
jgi:mercuric ion transport protein